MKTYINPQMQIVALQSSSVNCQNFLVASIGGDFGYSPEARPSDDQM